MAVFVFATLLYGSICICHIAIWHFLYLLHYYMALFVFVILIHLVAYAWCSGKKKIQKALRFRKKSSVEQYLTVYTEKSTSEITKKFTGPKNGPKVARPHLESRISVFIFQP